MKRVIKWTAILFLTVLLLLAGAALTFPYWFGSALAVAGNRFGTSIGKYEHLGGGRFVLTDVVRTNELFDLKISRVEAYLPFKWYREVKGSQHDDTFVEVNGWRVVLHPTDKTDSAPSTNQMGIYDRWQQVERSIGLAREWMPKATLLNGTVEFQKQDQIQDYTFPVITWEAGKLDVGGVWPVSAVPYDIKARLTGELPYQVSLVMSPLDLRARVRLHATNNVLHTTVAAFYQESKVDIEADFGPEGMLPTRATLSAPNFKIPGPLVKLEQFHEFTGTLAGQWQSNHYNLDLKAHADPVKSEAGAKIPPADLHLVASGDTNRVRIEQARSTAPGLELSLSDPIELTYGGNFLSERSEVRLAADLEKLPWLKVKGRLEGTVLLKKGEMKGEKLPLATLRIAGTDLDAFKVQAEKVEIGGELNWPQLDDFKFRAQLGTNAVLSITGSASLQEQKLGDTTLSFEGTLSTNLLPTGIQFKHISLKATASGTISNLTHSGRFAIRDLTTPPTQPLHLDGSWNAQQIAFETLSFRAQAGEAILRLNGRGYTEGNRTNFVLRELSLAKGDDIYLQMEREATVLLLPEQRVELSPLLLKGEDRELALAGAVKWPQTGRFEFQARNISPTLFQNFIKRSLQDFDLQRLALSASWSNSPVTGTLFANASMAQKQFERIGAELKVELSEDGLALSQMRLWDPSGQVGTAQGFLPLSLNLVEPPMIRFSKKDQIDFELRTGTNQTFWNTVGELAKLQFTNAAVDLVVHGTSEKPTGELHVRADTIAMVQTNRELPAIGPLEARIALNEQVLRVKDFSLRVLDQPISISGQLALGSNFWTQPRDAMLKYALNNGELRVEAPAIELAPFSTYLPQYLSPQGELIVNIAVKSGQNLEGHIELKDVATRPLPSVGVVQSIHARVNLSGKEVQVQEISGVVGGEKMTISGVLDVSEESMAKGYPDLDMSIKGNNLPLARNPDVILRSDLDLRVHNGTNRLPIISGSVTLRDSFLLRDITTMVPGRVASPSRRPPYFSIEQQPVDDWKLDVRVRGENFMRVRSPFFQGMVSANFNVVGTAKEPMALGEAAISGGRIIFPFAMLEVQQALVSLTTEDPYLPHIFALAGGRAFGFDIRMQAEGPADNPVIEFSSVPALSSEQIVLMLTTGQIPREDFSFSNKDRVSKLAFFVGKSLLAKLRPGKPAEEKLTIRSGQDITEQGKQTYEVEYKLSPKWSLVGEYDKFGAVNANVKWRILSR